MLEVFRALEGDASPTVEVIEELRCFFLKSPWVQKR